MVFIGDHRSDVPDTVCAVMRNQPIDLTNKTYQELVSIFGYPVKAERIFNLAVALRDVPKFKLIFDRQDMADYLGITIQRAGPTKIYDEEVVSFDTTSPTSAVDYIDKLSLVIAGIVAGNIAARGIK